jgi:putative ABC transport system permease protein
MRLLSFLVPRSWRETVLRDLEDEARERGRGRWWVMGQLVRVALRLRPAVNGDAMVSDLRYALRSLSRSKTFAAGAVLTFALGIGVNVAVFSIVDRMMLRPLPYGDAGKLVVMGEYTADSPNPYGTLNPTYVVEARQRHQGVVDLATTDPPVAYRLAPDSTATLAITEGSYNLLDVLGVRPLLGRSFTEDDVRAGRRGVVISFDAWRGRLSGRPDVVGQRLWSGGQPVEIIGVLPEGFYTPESIFGGQSDGVGLNLQALRMPYAEGVRETPPIIRLKDGVSLGAAEAELNSLMNSVRQAGGSSASQPSFFKLVPLRESMFGRYATYTWVVILAASLVLLMCCANLASLMLVRARSREHHTALQLALGASRYRVIRSALLESLLLAGVGTVTALVVVVWTHGALRAFVPAIFRRYAVEPTDVRVLGFSLLATVVCALIAGVGPVLRTSSASLGAVLQRSGGRSASAGRRGGALVLAAEALIAVLLVSGAAMTGRSLMGLMRVDLGFEREGLHFVAVQYDPFPPDPVVRFRQFNEALVSLRSTPGLRAVAAADVLPIMGAAGNRFLGNGSQTWRITDGFVGTMGMSLVAGRDFTAREVSTGAAVSMLSELGLKRVWPGVTARDAIGRVLHVEGRAPTQVVGVVGDVRGSGAARPDASLYLPITAEGFRVLRFVARTAPGGTVPLEEARRRLAASGNPGVVTASSVNDRLVISLRDQRFRAILFGSFAIVALVLACVGLYAVTSFEARLRQLEMGVRLALGAKPIPLQGVVLTSALRPVLAGTAAGLIIAWWVGEYLQSFLHQVDARDPWTLALVAAALAGTGVVAAWIPARRASRVDPAIVLRAQ